MKPGFKCLSKGVGYYRLMHLAECGKSSPLEDDIKTMVVEWSPTETPKNVRRSSARPSMTLVLVPRKSFPTGRNSTYNGPVAF